MRSGPRGSVKKGTLLEALAQHRTPHVVEETSTTTNLMLDIFLTPCNDTVDDVNPT